MGLDKSWISHTVHQPHGPVNLLLANYLGTKGMMPYTPSRATYSPRKPSSFLQLKKHIKKTVTPMGLSSSLRALPPPCGSSA